MAELKLEKFIANCENLSNIQNLDDNNPIVLRISHPTNATVHAVVCSVKEPSDLVLPLNVGWINLNPQSKSYRNAFVRKSKNANSLDGTSHTWEKVSTYDALMLDQFYDDVDSTFLSSDEDVPPASQTTLGVAKLSYAPKVSSSPIVVVEGDPRLTDPRTPVSHVHPQKPAEQLKTSGGIVTINTSNAPEQGMTLVATSPTSAEWRKLRNSDIS